MLVNCGVYENGEAKVESAGSLGELGEVKAYGKGRFAWIAYMEPTQEELAVAQDLCGLSDLAVEDALHGGQMPKIEEYGKGLFVVLRQYERAAAGELLEGDVCVFVEPRAVVSSRHGAGPGFGHVRARARAEPELLAKGPAYVLYALMDAVVDRYFPVVQDFERRVEELEERIFSKENHGGEARKAIAYELYALKREISQVKHGAEPMLEITSKLFGGRVPASCEGLGEYFRDVHDHLSRVLSSLERMRDALASATQTNLALVTIDESVTTKKLAAWAAIFGATTLMAGVWGMNFKHMPELEWAWGYPAALLAMFAVSAGMWAKFRRIGWL